MVTFIGVKSSNVHSIAYDGVNQAILVRFKEGKVYRYGNRLPEVWDALQRADSKGRFVRGLGKGTLESTMPTASTVAQDRREPLHTLTHEADRCCRGAWNAALETGTLGERFECPQCGSEYQPRDDGAIRFWNYVAWAVRL